MDGADRQAVYYLHIPKTAGSSLIGMLHSQYAEENICPAYLWHQLLRIPLETRESFALYRGHFYSYLDQAIGKPLRTVTFLREPIERSLSHYAHVLRERSHYLHRRATQLGSLRAFLNDPVTATMVTDFQVRALAQKIDPLRAAADMSDEDLDSLRLEKRLVTTMPDESAMVDLLARAKEALSKCAYVGLTEQFDESVAGLARVLQWQRTPTPTRANVSPERLHVNQLDEATRRALERHTRLDRALYAHALIIFDAQRGRAPSPQLPASPA